MAERCSTYAGRRLSRGRRGGGGGGKGVVEEGGMLSQTCSHGNAHLSLPPLPTGAALIKKSIAHLDLLTMREFQWLMSIGTPVFGS